MLKNEQHSFSSLTWKTVPFELYPKAAFDCFVDILFSMLPCLSIAQEVIRSPPEESDRPITELGAAIENIMVQLDMWWTQIMSVPIALGADAGQWHNASSTFPGSQCNTSDPDHFPLIPHSDMRTAALGSLYDAANVVVLQLLYLVSPHAQLYEKRMQKHIQSILSAKEFVAAIPSSVSERGLLMIEFPLQILQVWDRKSEINAAESSHTAESARDYGLDCSSELFGHLASYIHTIQIEVTKNEG